MGTFAIRNIQPKVKIMLISTNLLTFQKQMSNVEKKETEELLSKDKEGLGGYCHIWAEFYEENTQFIIFLCAQIAGVDLD